MEADRLVGVYGVHAYEEARRRRFQAETVSAARYWLRVKAEIGRRVVAACGDAARFDRPDSTLSGFDPAFRPESPDSESNPQRPLSAPGNGEAPPARADRSAVTDRTRGVRRRQAEADMRAAMKAGDIDGVRRALGRMAPEVFAPN